MSTKRYTLYFHRRCVTRECQLFICLIYCSPRAAEAPRSRHSHLDPQAWAPRHAFMFICNIYRVPPGCRGAKFRLVGHPRPAQTTRLAVVLRRGNQRESLWRRVHATFMFHCLTHRPPPVIKASVVTGVTFMPRGCLVNPTCKAKLPNTLLC